MVLNTFMLYNYINILFFTCFMQHILAPVINSPENFVLEELTPDHIQPPRHKKVANTRNKVIYISDAKFSECLRNPTDLLQSVSVHLLHI